MTEVLARNKRVIYVNGKPLSLGDMYLWEWLQPESYGASEAYLEGFTELANLFVQEPQKWIEKFNKYGFEPYLVNRMWSVVNVSIKYRHDTETFKRADWWQLPSETWKNKAGDCEDTAFLLASAVYRIVPEDRCYACIGFYNDSGTLYGHAYPIYYPEYLKKWVVLESTLEVEVPMLLWISWDPELYVPAIIFNVREAYRMDSPEHRLKFGLSDAWFEKYREPIYEMIRYVETGKPVKYEYVHKEKRPVKVSLESLVV